MVEIGLSRKVVFEAAEPHVQINGERTSPLIFCSNNELPLEGHTTLHPQVGIAPSGIRNHASLVLPRPFSGPSAASLENQFASHPAYLIALGGKTL